MLSRCALVLALALGAPAWARADRGEFLVAARAGASFSQPFSSLGTSYLAGFELGWVLPVWRHRLAFTLDGQLSAPDADGQSSAPGVVGGSYRWHLQTRQVALGVTAFVRQPIGRTTLYLGVGPRLIVLDSEVDGASSAMGRIAPSRERSPEAGLGVVPGVGVRLGPGQLFFELPVIVAAIEQRTTGSVSAGSIALGAGYRVLF
jgi:hypothetical protein